MSDAFSQLNALLAAAAAAAAQQQQQQQQKYQNQFHQVLNQPHPTNIPPLFNQPNLPHPLNTEHSLQSLLFKQQQLNKQNIEKSFNKPSNLPPNSSLDSIPLPLLSQIPLPQTETDLFFNNNQQQQLLKPQQIQQQQQNQDYFNFASFNTQPNELDFQKISLNETKSNLNTSSNFDNSNLSIGGDGEIYLNEQTYMPGTASLIGDVDKQLMVVLRDGRTLIGFLRSIDQYANLLLSSTIERIHVGDKYGDIPRGIYIVRGENVVLIGEVDFTLPHKVDMIKVEVNEILELQKVEQKKLEAEKSKKKALLERGFLAQTDAVLDEYY